MSHTFKQIWDNLSQINISNHTNKRQNFTYLSWSYAWGVLMEEYPDAEYAFDDPVYLQNRTCEVWVTVTIGEIKRRMWLPVMDHKNKSIEEPTTRDISDARMRCLVKCIAMFGLGHSIYAGEDLPVFRPDYTEQMLEHFENYIEEEDALSVYLASINQDAYVAMIKKLKEQAPKGTKTALAKKIDDLYAEGKDSMISTAEKIADGARNDDAFAVTEILDEIDSPFEKRVLWEMLDDQTHSYIKTLKEAA